MIHKTISYRRRANEFHKNRRVFIGLYCMSWDSLTTNAKAQGKLRKGKIHCSCPLCTCKSTTSEGKHTNSLAGYSASDKRKFDSLTYSYKEYTTA